MLRILAFLLVALATIPVGLRAADSRQAHRLG